MMEGELLNIEPQDQLIFPFELRKQISSEVRLTNNTEYFVAFKFKTTNPKRYCVKPNGGVVLPRSTCKVIVTMQAQKEVPSDMQCKDKFMIQSLVVSRLTDPKDVLSTMFNGERGLIKEQKLKVVYITPCQQCSSEAVRSGSFSPKPSVRENGNLNGSQGQQVTGAVSHIDNKLSEAGVGKLLKIEPSEVKFPFELKKQAFCSLYLSNITESHVAFKVTTTTTNAKKYCVQPVSGVVLPQTTCAVTVTMLAQEEAPIGMQCKDKFLIQSVRASPSASLEDGIFEMLNKKAGHKVEECNLPVILLSPPLPLFPASDGLESSLKENIKENKNLSTPEITRPLLSDYYGSSKELLGHDSRKSSWSVVDFWRRPEFQFSNEDGANDDQQNTMEKEN